MECITIPFAVTDAINPNIAINKSLPDLEVYYSNICVTFASLRYFNKDIELKLFTDTQVPFQFAQKLQQYKVKIEIYPYKFSPPKFIGKRFAGCFYLFDAISRMEVDTLFIDPDIICISNLDNFTLDFNKENRIAALDLQFSNLKNVNGLTHTEACKVASSLTNRIYLPLKHFGGEAIYIPIKDKKNLIDEIELLWSSMNEKNYFPTEEHILSVIFTHLQISNLNKIVNRIWTSKSYRKVEGGNKNIDRLYLWHLPSEKSKGFITIYRHLQDTNNHEIFENPRKLKKALSLNFVLIRNLRAITYGKLAKFRTLFNF